MSRKIKWGILGCAAIAENAFIPALKKARNAEPLTIASRDAARAKKWAERFSFAKFYSSYEELLSDPEIDAVYNPLPNHLHHPWTIKAVRAKKHVLCEKPLALTAQEVKEMFEEASRNGVVLMEGFMYRFHPQINKALDLIRSGEIGKPFLIRSAFTFPFNRGKDNYRWSPQKGGGALYDVGCYTINAARLIFQQEPDEIYARPHLDEQTGIDLTTSLLCSFSGGRQALLVSSFELQFQSSLEVSGDLGRIFLARAFSAKHFGTEIQILKGDETETIKLQPADQFQLMVEHFGDIISGRARPRLGFNDSYGNARVIDAAFRSIKSNRPIRLKEI